MNKLRILLVESSPRAPANSAALARHLIAAIVQRTGREIELVERNLAAPALPPMPGEYAESLLIPHAEAIARYGDALVVSDQLIAELEWADILVIAAPVYNFTVPATLKLWIDLVVRKGVTFQLSPEGKQGMLRNRPVLVAATAGSAMFGKSSKQPDFFRPYLDAALGVVGLRDVSYVPATGLAFAEQPFEQVAVQADAWIEENLAGFVARFDKEAA